MLYNKTLLQEFEVADNVAESISKTIVDDDYNFLSVLSKVDFNADNIVDERENGICKKKEMLLYLIIIFVCSCSDSCEIG